FEYVRSEISDPSSLAGHSVFGLTTSRDNVLWAGARTVESTGWDLIAIDRESGTNRKWRPDSDLPEGQRNSPIFGLLEDRQGAIWVGTWNGITRLHRGTGRFYRFPIDPDNPNRLAGARVLHLFQDRAGFIWVAAYGFGLHRWDPKEPDRFKRFFHNPADSTTLPTNQVRHVAEDQAGFIWVGHNEGLSRLDPLSGKATHYRHDPKDPTTLSGNLVDYILERRREPGVIWVAVNGLNRLDQSGGKVIHYTVEDGLPNNTIYGILEDEQGRLWMSTNNGLSRFDPETEAFRNYGLEVGLQSLEFNINAVHRARSGEMFFGGINGINAFFPNELTESSVPPEVRLVDLKLGNESIKRSRAVRFDKPIPALDQIRLGYDQKDVTFDFVGFHFEHPEKNTFAYKLEGYNEDWVQSGHSRTAAYTNLAPGEYTFRVKAANAAGVWNEEGASIKLIITPPFWATWWFRILAFLGIAGIIYTGYRARVEQIHRRSRALESEVDRRTQELRASNTQLEQSHTIVQAINQETSFRRLLTKILEESRVIPGVEKATALVHMTDDDRFHVRASSGWDVAAMQNIRLTASEAHRRYVEQADRVAEDIYVAKDVANRAGTEQMAEFGRVASFLVLRIRVEELVVAYLVYDNLTDQDAFDQRDIELLERLRDHITSAFIKTRILDDLQTTLTSLQSTQDRLIQSEKMASLGQLTAGIAHEIKNPLNFVNNFSDVTTEVASEMAEELARRRNEMPADLVVDFEEMIENLKRNTRKIAEHGKRADAIVQNMLEHSKVGEGERTPTNLNELLDEYVTLAVHGLEARGGGFKVNVVREFDGAIGQVDLVPQDMGRVFMNLMSNAFDVLKEHGSPSGAPTVTIGTAQVDGIVEVRVTDNGPGIPPKVKARIFEPFFTTKPTGSGTGLGLSMSYDIVTKGHGGTLDVVSEEGQGATFIVRLPG
ncbi:MAG TPA: ATP-binding protein, partial [Rhodothermia bacterium]|nr:ATP-binding protein [Rhodothermia bacterium]